MTSTPLEWFKSSHSSNEGPDCLEVALTPAAVHIRDSKDRDGARLTVADATWTEFLGFAVHDA
ncbi:DUF397 domain-containing protein [Streptomyces sp. NPDC090108]|uniref:DUF397 domain-containing protein n=1 Tax=Streptomyces sp. NPDC090108 TaxID=3365947 RepID=UPI003805F813